MGTCAGHISFISLCNLISRATIFSCIRDAICHKRASGGGKSLFLKLIKPYLTFSIIAIVAYLIRDYLMGGNYLDNLVLNVYKTITGYGIHALWFIPSYFIACTVYKCIMPRPIWVIILWMLVFVFVGIGASELIRYMGNRSILSDYFYYPFVGLTRGLTCTFYIFVGSILWHILTSLKRFSKNILAMIFIMLLCLVGSYFSSQNLGEANFSLLRLGSFPLMIYISGLLGAAGFVLLFYLLRAVRLRTLEYIGKNSLTIMGTHMSMLFTIIATAIMIRVWPIEPQPAITYYLWGLGCVAIVIILEIPTIWIFNNKLKFLINRI